MTNERSRRRLLLFNLMTDADDPILGFTTGWVRALADRIGCIDVVTMHSGRLVVPGNVRVFSVGRERGYSEARRTIEFYRILRRLLAGPRYDAAFAHMMPLFAVMSAPLLKLRRIPMTLWFAHKATNRTLRLAERVVDHVVTPSQESFRAPSRKVVVTGHGIDTEVFRPGPGSVASNRPFTVLSSSRLSPVKRVDVLIEAAAILRQRSAGQALRLRLVGPTFEKDRDYAARLRRRVAQLGLDEVVEFAGPRPPYDMPDVYRHADLLVSMSETGSIDKANLEAMACGLPVVTSNEAFRKLVMPIAPELLMVPNGDERALARSLAAIQALPVAERQRLGEQLRASVVDGHSLDRLADRLVDEILFR